MLIPIIPGFDSRAQYKEGIFGSFSGEMWALVARFCSSIDFASLSRVSFQTHEGSKKYITAFVYRTIPAIYKQPSEATSLKLFLSDVQWLLQERLIKKEDLSCETTLATLVPWFQSNRRIRVIETTVYERIHEDDNYSERAAHFFVGISTISGCVASPACGLFSCMGSYLLSAFCLYQSAQQIKVLESRAESRFKRIRAITQHNYTKPTVLIETPR